MRVMERSPLAICSDACWARYLYDGALDGGWESWSSDLSYGHEPILAWMLSHGVFVRAEDWVERELAYYPTAERYFVEKFPVLRQCPLDENGINVNLWYALWASAFDSNRCFGGFYENLSIVPVRVSPRGS